MCTAHLPTIHPSVATWCQHCRGKVPQVNKFEQVSSLGHLISLTAVGQGLGRSPLQWVPVSALGSLYSGVFMSGGEVPVQWGHMSMGLGLGDSFMVRSNASWVMVTFTTVDRLTNWQKDWKNITFPLNFVDGRQIYDRGTKYFKTRHTCFTSQIVLKN